MKNTPCIPRRSFVKYGFAAAAVPTIVPRHVLGGPTAPSNRITLGGVGVGGVGHGQLKGLAKAGLLAKEGDKIDAVYCGTPDHTHAFVTLAALRAKKHVCCVKPLTRSIEECYLVAEEARKAGVATQVTASPCTSDAACRTREIVASGILGDIVETYAWTRRPVWPQGMPAYPSFTTPVPGTLDWDLWIGSAEKRPYADKWPDDNPIPKMCPEAWKGAAVYHPFNHRGWYDFGAGALGDMGCHWANTIYKALVAFPLASVVTFDYPKRGNFPELRFTWCDGLIKPPAPKELAGAPLPKEGVMYVGTKAKMLISMEKQSEMRILDPKLDAQAKTIPATLPRRGQIWDEWMTACKGGEKAGCDFSWARRITEFVLRLRPEDDARHEQSGRRRPPAPQVLQRLEPVGRPSAAELSSRGRQ